MKVLVLGAIFLDIKGYPNGKYIPTGRNAGHIEYTYGGVMRNIAEDINNAGEETSFITIIDNTELSDEMLGDLKNKHINVDNVVKKRDGIGTWLAVFDENGELAGSISKRPNLSTLCSLLDEKGEEIFSKADCVVFAVDEDSDLTYRIINICKKLNKKIYSAVSNMNIAIRDKHLFKDLDLIVCNDIEAEVMFNISFNNTTIDEKINLIKENTIANNYKNIVVTFGPLGAIYVDENREAGFIPSLSVDVIDTTGAGDAFFSGTVVGLNNGCSLKLASMFGTKMASLTIAQMESVCPQIKLTMIVD